MPQERHDPPQRNVWRSKHLQIAEQLVDGPRQCVSANVPVLQGASERVRDIVDLGYNIMKRFNSTLNEEDLYIDVSQCASRSPWVSNGVLKAMTTSTQLYCYSQQRFVTPIELGATLGFEKDVYDYRCLTVSDQKQMLGESMSVPCIGLVMLSLACALPIWEST